MDAEGWHPGPGWSCSPGVSDVPAPSPSFPEKQLVVVSLLQMRDETGRCPRELGAHGPHHLSPSHPSSNSHPGLPEVDFRGRDGMKSRCWSQNPRARGRASSPATNEPAAIPLSLYPGCVPPPSREERPLEVFQPKRNKKQRQNKSITTEQEQLLEYIDKRAKQTKRSTLEKQRQDGMVPPGAQDGAKGLQT